MPLVSGTRRSQTGARDLAFSENTREGVTTEREKDAKREKERESKEKEDCEQKVEKLEPPAKKKKTSSFSTFLFSFFLSR